MRISDSSSDLCSSDLPPPRRIAADHPRHDGDGGDPDRSEVGAGLPPEAHPEGKGFGFARALEQIRVGWNRRRRSTDPVNLLYPFEVEIFCSARLAGLTIFGNFLLRESEIGKGS